MLARTVTGIWSLDPFDGYVVLRVSGKFDDNLSKKFDDERRNYFGVKDPCHWVVDCEHLPDLTPMLTKSLLQLHRDLKNLNKKIRLISACEDIRSAIINGGLNKALSLASGLKEALVDFGLSSSRPLDVNFINPFLDGTIKTLKVQASIDAVPGKLYRQTDTSAPFIGDISGVIGLVSDAFNGSVVISFPQKTFLAIMSKMLGEEFTELTQDLQDGASELTNIIFGQAKTTLNEKGYAIKTAIPSVITGKNHKITSVSSGPRVVVPFSSEAGDFCVEICLSE